MQRTSPNFRTAPAVVVGSLLIVVGIVVLAARQLGLDLGNAVGETGWPVFVVVPGLILLAAAVVPQPPRGIGFAIAGSIVTVVGLLLWYQANSGNWESWAYLWALVPLAIGGALLGYGSLTGEAGMVRAGAWVGGTAAIVLAIGAWYFEARFAGRGEPFAFGTIWPIAIIAIGVLIAARALRPSHR